VAQRSARRAHRGFRLANGCLVDERLLDRLLERDGRALDLLDGDGQGAVGIVDENVRGAGRESRKGDEQCDENEDQFRHGIDPVRSNGYRF